MTELQWHLLAVSYQRCPTFQSGKYINRMSHLMVALLYKRGTPFNQIKPSGSSRTVTCEVNMIKVNVNEGHVSWIFWAERLSSFPKLRLFQLWENLQNNSSLIYQYVWRIWYRFWLNDHLKFSSKWFNRQTYFRLQWDIFSIYKVNVTDLGFMASMTNPAIHVLNLYKIRSPISADAHLNTVVILCLIPAK